METKNAPVKAVIFAYQVGFGDCFLVRFEYPGARRRHVLIDFGTTGLPKDAAKDMLVTIANDIKDKCNGKLDAVVATHRHADHISGFATANGKGPGDIIRGLKPTVVVQPWTEDPAAATDATVPTALAHKSLKGYTSSLSRMHRTAAKVLGQLESRPGSFSKEMAERIKFIGEDNLANRSAVKNLASMGEKPPIYTYHGGPSGLGRILGGVKVHVLGPPTLAQTDTIRKQRSRDPDEFWHLRMKSLDVDERLTPQQSELFPGHPTRSGGKLPMSARWFSSRVKLARSDQVLQIVRALDNQMNNTSLILLLETRKKKLLFPGDAQLENWEYALSKKKLRDLISDVDVYKVGHHGSLNATPRSMWAAFKKKSRTQKKDRLTTIMSTMPGKHGKEKSHTEVPRQSLLSRLQAESNLHSTHTLEAAKLYDEIEIDLR